MWEGEYEFYVVQFRSPGYPTRNKPEWCDFDCTSGLFHGLTYEQKNGLQGDRYRALLKPGHATWQRTGSPPECSFDTLEQADDVLEAIVRRNLPRHAGWQFRVVKRRITKKTTPVWDISLPGRQVA